jgi:DNA-binding transcriptional ArsR family regulator
MNDKQAVAALMALAQESRLRVFRYLVKHGGSAPAAGEIADQLEIPPATLTFHLKELARAGLIESQRDGRFIRYTLRVAGMRELLDFLTNDCCQGHPELCDARSCSRTTKNRRKVARR